MKWICVSFIACTCECVRLHVAVSVLYSIFCHRDWSSVQTTTKPFKMFPIFFSSFYFFSSQRDRRSNLVFTKCVSWCVAPSWYLESVIGWFAVGEGEQKCALEQWGLNLINSSGKGFENCLRDSAALVVFSKQHANTGNYSIRMFSEKCSIESLIKWFLGSGAGDVCNAYF